MPGGTVFKPGDRFPRGIPSQQAISLRGLRRGPDTARGVLEGKERANVLCVTRNRLPSRQIRCAHRPEPAKPYAGSRPPLARAGLQQDLVLSPTCFVAKNLGSHGVKVKVDGVENVQRAP